MFQQPSPYQQQLPGAQPGPAFQPPTQDFPGTGQGPGMGAGAGPGMGPTVPGGGLPPEQSYVENILRLNRGKLATVYATFENNREWNAKIFKGIIEAAGRDHLILSDPQTGMRYLILMVYVDYVTFDEEIEYEYPYAGAQGPALSTYPPR
ncbi:spore coat protein GerQ [Peribacillus deserti]|uniref:Spore coat protein GerQ n=2 Tax=Peribacillus deserti TaxID=673318 RepID=A0A2N5M7F6_9BACI|nr:spore coat protein GerQ [Peribacillus deserti]